MEATTYRKTQQNMLEKFFEDYFEKSKINTGYNIVGIIFIVMLLIVLWIPYQIHEEEPIIKTCGLIWGMVGYYVYLNKYKFAFDKRGAITKVYPYLQYLPISKRELKIFQLKKLIFLQTRVYLIAQVGQLLFGLIAYHQVTLSNFGFPFGHALLFPFLVVGISILVSR